MPEQNERPRPHGDPLEEVVDTADSPDGGEAAGNQEEIADEADADLRKKLYRDGAVLVSKID